MPSNLAGRAEADTKVSYDATVQHDEVQQVYLDEAHRLDWAHRMLFPMPCTDVIEKKCAVVSDISL